MRGVLRGGVDARLRAGHVEVEVPAQHPERERVAVGGAVRPRDPADLRPVLEHGAGREPPEVPLRQAQARELREERGAEQRRAGARRRRAVVQAHEDHPVDPGDDGFGGILLLIEFRAAEPDRHDVPPGRVGGPGGREGHLHAVRLLRVHRQVGRLGRQQLARRVRDDEGSVAAEIIGLSDAHGHVGASHRRRRADDPQAHVRPGLQLQRRRADPKVVRDGVGPGQ